MELNKQDKENIAIIRKISDRMKKKGAMDAGFGGGGSECHTDVTRFLDSLADVVEEFIKESEE